MSDLLGVPCVHGEDATICSVCWDGTAEERMRGRDPHAEGLMREAWAALVADAPGDCRSHLDALSTRDVFVVRALATVLRNLCADSLAYRPADPLPKGDKDEPTS